VQARETLVKLVHSFQESGQTALGPALLVSVGIAGIAPGSSVVLCTDGLANVGCGSLENYNKQTADAHPAPAFYEQVSVLAVAKGVSVSVMSIKGTTANLELIGKVASATKGFNEIVDPLKNIGKNFNFALQNAIVATDVRVSFFLHAGLKFRHEEKAEGLRAIREVGNVAKESALTFEYELADSSLVHGIDALPFQVQITYTRLDGSKCMRVLTKLAKVTAKREVAEGAMNVGVVGMHAQQQSAQLASRGQYTKARMAAKSAMRMAKRAVQSSDATEQQQAELSAWTSEAVVLNKHIKASKMKEEDVVEARGYDSAEEDASDEEREEKETAPKKAKKEEKQDLARFRAVRRAAEDSTSNALYQAASPIYSKFKK